MKKFEVFGVIFVVTTTFIHFSLVQGTQIWPQLTKCSLEDSVCLTEQAQKYLQAFVRGMPELGIPVLDKLTVEPLVANYDNFLFNWTDINVTGLKDAVIDKVSVDMELKYLRLLFHTDLVVDFFHSLDGVMLSTLPISGSGKGKITIKNIHMDLLVLFDIIKDNNGKDFMELKTFKYGSQISEGFVYLENNKWNKKQSEQFHKFANEFWRLLVFNYSKDFQLNVASKIFDAVKLYMRSRPLETLALYNNN